MGLLTLVWPSVFDNVASAAVWRYSSSATDSDIARLAVTLHVSTDDEASDTRIRSSAMFTGVYTDNWTLEACQTHLPRTTPQLLMSAKIIDPELKR